MAIDGFKAFLRGWSAHIRAGDIDEAAGLVCYVFNFMLLGPLLHGDDMRRSRLGGRKRFAHALASLAYRYLTCGERTVGGRARGNS
jgi:hypothetical protein